MARVWHVWPGRVNMCVCVRVACADKCVPGPHCSKDLLVVVFFPFVVGFQYTFTHVYHKVKIDEMRCSLPRPSPIQACPGALGVPCLGFLVLIAHLGSTSPASSCPCLPSPSPLFGCARCRGEGGPGAVCCLKPSYSGPVWLGHGLGHLLRRSLSLHRPRRNSPLLTQAGVTEGGRG